MGGTNFWVSASCKRTQNSEKSNGTVHFGLFTYQSYLNFGLGNRPYTEGMLEILYRERTFLLYELFIATIGLVAGGIFFGLAAAMLPIVNTASNPIEAICHIPGLYLTNGLALFSTVAAIVSWMVQFYLRLTHNVLTYEDREKGRWSSEGMASFGYSFFFVVIAAVVYIGNIIIIRTATWNKAEAKKAKQLNP